MKKLGVLLAVELCDFENEIAIILEFVGFFFLFQRKEFMISYDKIITLRRKSNFSV